MLDVFGLFSVETLYVLIGIIALLVIAIVLSIVAIAKSSSMKKKYNKMMMLSCLKVLMKITQLLLRIYMKSCSIHSRKLELSNMMHFMRWVEN